jgi:hypothetical protein
MSGMDFTYDAVSTHAKRVGEGTVAATLEGSRESVLACVSKIGQIGGNWMSGSGLDCSRLVDAITPAAMCIATASWPILYCAPRSPPPSHSAVYQTKPG